jgi:hypothetical protein
LRILTQETISSYSTLMRSTIRILALLTLVNIAAFAQETGNTKKPPQDDKPVESVKHLSGVRRIFVAEFGIDPDSQEFHELVMEAIGKQGFTVVKSADNSDAVLIGSLLSLANRDLERARASAMLLSASGDTMWEYKIYTPPLADRAANLIATATDIATHLREAWDKDAKKHHAKPLP